MNLLKNASSPYLQQHAQNPVHWHEWNEETLAKAKALNKPLLISIGYAACHWCHVMARETFMNNEAASVMNQHFICIKIDREERPDVDQVYMEAVQLIKGSGGWPLNAFALPNGKPFYAGTYYPTQSWIAILNQLANLYENDYFKLVEQALQLSQNIQKHQLIPVMEPTNEIFTIDFLNALFSSWKGRIDMLRGGFGSAPKFPLPVGLNFLLEYHQLTNNKDALKILHSTLTAMANGGIYDQIGGGFARYSVDAYWRIPHFEKMLYDNGQLVSLYAKAYLLDENPLYKKIITQTLAFIERELMDSNNGFYASLNADSEGEEGTFYIFTKKELEEYFTKNIADFIIDYYHFSDEGNWEHGKNALFTVYSPLSYSQKMGCSEDEVLEMLQQANSQLFKYRSKRIRPTTDTKILTSWNALMITGFIDAYIALSEPNYLVTAIKNADFVSENLIKDDFSLWRNYHNNKATIKGFLEDYAFLAEAFINLYQVTLNSHWLTFSKNLIDYCIAHFYDESNEVFYFTSNSEKALYVKKYELYDNVTPSSNSVMATVLHQLGLLFDDQHYLSIAEKLLIRMTSQLKNSGPYTGKWNSLLSFKIFGSPTIAIVGPNAHNYAIDLLKAVNLPLLLCGGIEENIPYLKNKFIKGKTAFYVCKNNSCSQPLYALDDVLFQLNNSNY